MTACTERQCAARVFGLEGEGQKGMPKVAHGMTACTERQCAARVFGLDGEGQKGMPKVAQP